MLNVEELLIKIMKLLDFDMNDVKLKQTLEKRRFYTQEESAEKYRKHTELILKKLNLDVQNKKLVDIFIDLINLYLPIYNKLNLTKFVATQEKINWIILKRLFVPYLAKRFSSLDYEYNTRIDKGLSGGKFWYLPDVTQYPKIKLPMEYLMNWWLDLYGKGLDSLCNEIDDNNINMEKPLAGSKNAIKQWFKKSIPDKKSIKEYCSVPLNYNGIFKINDKDNTDVQFKKACDFITNIKKLSVEDLKLEIPYNSLVDKIFVDIEKISKNDKKEFLKFISERWAKPTEEKLINSFIIARSSQSIYKSLLNYFSFKDSNDIEENKLLQLVYLYCYIYNENFQRRLHQVHKYNTEDFTDINYEYLDSLNNDFYGTIETISNDINIELSNQNFPKDYLEDIYQVKVIVYMQKVDNRTKTALGELKEHFQYFHLKFDKIEKELEKYFSLLSKDKIGFIDNVEDFQCLMNICDRELLHNYELAEKCIFQMQSLSKTSNEELLIIFQFLNLYTILIIENNIMKFQETSRLVNQYEKLTENIEEKYIELLKLKIHFYIKSKQFDNALKISNEYFTKYIKAHKKDIDSIDVLYLGAYAAYIQKDKNSLKQFNKYLKKYTNKAFENSQSLPFKIFFYKK
nr:hypothetical protein [Pseudodesulfovibrio sp.]